MERKVTQHLFAGPVCGSNDLKRLDMIPAYTEVVSVKSDAQIEFGDEPEHDWDGIEESYFVCGGCRREFLIDDERISSSDPCTLLKWFREKNGTPKEEVLQE
jgi:hypothetical protein